MPKKIFLDQSKLFDDYRKKAFVLVQNNWRSIEDLQAHIRNLFSLDFHIYLTTKDETLLPAAEKIQLVEDLTEIRVHKISLNKLMGPAMEEICRVTQKTKLSTCTSSTSSSSSDSSEPEDVVIDMITTDQSFTTESIKPKRKRVRKRKKKQQRTVPELPKPSAFIPPRSIATGKHIRFDETPKKFKPCNISNVPRVRVATVKITTKGPESNGNNGVVSHVEDSEFVKMAEVLTSPEIYLLPSLESEPTIGDLIAFKFYTLNTAMECFGSMEAIGTVKDIYKHSKMLTVEALDSIFSDIDDGTLIDLAFPVAEQIQGSEGKLPKIVLRKIDTFELDSIVAVKFYVLNRKLQPLMSGFVFGAVESLGDVCGIQTLSSGIEVHAEDIEQKTVEFSKLFAKLLNSNKFNENKAKLNIEIM